MNFTKTAALIDVTFSDSLCGMLKMGDYYSDRFEKNRKCLSLDIFADIGDLSGGLFSKNRRRQINEMQSHVYLWRGDYFSKRRWVKMKKTVMRMVTACEKGAHIRVWTGDQPAEVCGFMAVIGLLSAKKGSISVVHRESSAANKKKNADSWGLYNPQDLASFLDDERVLDDVERQEIAEQYEKLCSNSGVLRAVVDGKLTPVPEDHYDELIRRQIPEGDFRMPEVFSNVLRHEKTFVPFDFLQCRCARILCSSEFLQVGSVSPKMPHSENRPPIYNMIFRRKSQ